MGVKKVSKIKVAIDGPVSSGKSSAGSKTAAALNYQFIDTVIMYRALAYKIKIQNIPSTKWKQTAEAASFKWVGDLSKPSLILDGTNVSRNLFSPEISSFTSKVASVPEIRKILVSIQRKMAEDGGIVMVGRDIGTVVLPDAELKIFLTASLDARIKRRYEELNQSKTPIPIEKLKIEILERDKRDTTRSDSPLQIAENGIEIDSTHLTLDEVVEMIVKLAKDKESRD